ncbi:hypothetical protein BDZ91DRAFT_760200 [Kalaharituber pfeilii]|nr:hypothetical protein BDZ91DRAFT_760200 [Kalaharituber pfeilii]
MDIIGSLLVAEQQGSQQLKRYRPAEMGPFVHVSFGAQRTKVVPTKSHRASARPSTRKVCGRSTLNKSGFWRLMEVLQQVFWTVEGLNGLWKVRRIFITLEFSRWAEREQPGFSDGYTVEKKVETSWDYMQLGMYMESTIKLRESVDAEFATKRIA